MSDCETVMMCQLVHPDSGNCSGSGCLCETIAEADEHKIELYGPDGNRFSGRNIDASTHHEIEGIIARVRCSGARGLISLEQT